MVKKKSGNVHEEDVFIMAFRNNVTGQVHFSTSCRASDHKRISYMSGVVLDKFGIDLTPFTFKKKLVDEEGDFFSN